MRVKTMEIAREAGFIFWGNETYKPQGQIIDWASDYDADLDKFYEMVVRQCMAKVAELAAMRVPASEYAKELEAKMLDHSYVINVQADENGELFITIPDTIMKHQGWGEGTKLEWIDTNDGKFILRGADEGQV